MKIDTLLPPGRPAEVATRAQQSESQGFDCVWTFEAAHDPFLPLAYAASATSSLELGTNIAVAFGRSPFAMAQTAWDLQAHSGGRFHLGLGTQVRAHIERRFSMPFDKPAARITDYIRCIKAIWDNFQNGTRPSYEGPFYQFKLMNPFFEPGAIDHPEIPIYLAGVNARMCRAAGEVCDGFHVHPMHSRAYLTDVVRPAIDEGAKTRGLAVSDLVLYAPVFVITGEDEQERSAMEQTVRQQVAFYGSTPNYRAVLEYHGYNELQKALNALMREGKFSEMAALVPDALVEELAVICPPAQIGQKLRARCDGVLDRISLYMSMGNEGNFERWDELTAAVHAA
ncbi:MAG: TIGR03617 family F420-dependent LLM class oxidoreductase [Pseudomonadota bacterium]